MPFLCQQSLMLLIWLIFLFSPKATAETFNDVLSGVEQFSTTTPTIIPIPPTLTNTPPHHYAAHLRILNRITSLSEEKIISPKQPLFLGQLEIALKRCVPSDRLHTIHGGLPQPDKALLELWEHRPLPTHNNTPLQHNGLSLSKRQEHSKGWLIAGQPMISLPAHPIYTVLLVGCEEVTEEIPHQQE